MSLAVVGLGLTEMGKVWGSSAEQLAIEAIARALADAGLRKSDLDGLIINSNMSPEMAPTLQMALGVEDMGIVCGMTSYGATTGAMFAQARALLAQKQADVIALVYSDVPIKQPGSLSTSSSYSGKASLHEGLGMGELRLSYGNIGSGTIEYAMAARRHMELFGTTSEQLGEIAVAQRAWAQLNPLAQMHGKSMTLGDHQDSRLVVDPLHLLDCCLVSNGAVAVIVTSSDRARDLRQPPVHLLGVGLGSPGDNWRSGREPFVHTGAKRASQQAFAQAGVDRADIDVLELYDCYTYTVLVTLEDYGFCEKGEGGAFVSGGRLGPEGKLPLNTGGGQLSAFYMWGFTPLSEAIIQLRHQAGERQVSACDLALVSGNGGNLNWHSTMIFAAAAA